MRRQLRPLTFKQIYKLKELRGGPLHTKGHKIIGNALRYLWTTPQKHPLGWLKTFMLTHGYRYVEQGPEALGFYGFVNEKERLYFYTTDIADATL